MGTKKHQQISNSQSKQTIGVRSEFCILLSDDQLLREHVYSKVNFLPWLSARRWMSNHDKINKTVLAQGESAVVDTS